MSYLNFHHKCHVLFIVFNGLLKKSFDFFWKFSWILVAQSTDMFSWKVS